mgnify:CR=1 FL=1
MRRLTQTTARALAQQVALYDQQGCLSPQIACVEEADRDAMAAFTALVADELGALEAELPRATPTLAESAAVWRFSNGNAGERRRALTSPSTAAATGARAWSAIGPRPGP